jgi:hypothetical protein
MNPQFSFTIPELISPIVVAVIFIAACSLFNKTARHNFSAIFLAGAGAAYLNGTGCLGVCLLHDDDICGISRTQ